eukprot:491551-Hanusia_phi.AAC.3
MRRWQCCWRLASKAGAGVARQSAVTQRGREELTTYAADSVRSKVLQDGGGSGGEVGETNV